METALVKKLKELKQLLFATPEGEPAKDDTAAEKQEVKSKDGKTYKVSGLESGASIEVVAEDGSTAPAPDGEVELEDGKVIVVKEGKIESVKDAPKEDATKEGAPAAFNADDFVSKEAFAALQTSFNDLSEKFAALVKEKESNKQVFSAIYSAIEAFSEESTASASDAPKQKHFSEHKNKTLTARENLSQALKQINGNK